MTHRIHALFFVSFLFLAGGCTTVGNTLGDLGPERDRGAAVMAAAAAPERPGFSTSAFCPEPLRELYMVMPENGHVGRLSVTFDDGSQLLLEGDYAGAELKGGRRNELTGDAEMLKREFGTAVAALPEAPLVATLYFRFGSTDLSDSSQANVQYIFRQIMSMQDAQVSITGHTDTVGSGTRNQALSVSRAEKVRDQLIRMGLPAERIIAVSGKGEAELLVQTADNVREERNRRVEISVR